MALWSAQRWTTANARLAGLPLVGENPGGPALAHTGGAPDSDGAAEQLRHAPRYARDCGLTQFYWAFEETLVRRTLGRRSDPMLRDLDEADDVTPARSRTCPTSPTDRYPLKDAMLPLLLLANALFMTVIAATTFVFQSYKWWRPENCDPDRYGTPGRATRKGPDPARGPVRGERDRADARAAGPPRLPRTASSP